MHIEIPSLLREGSPSLSLHTVRVPKHQESASKSQEGYWAVWQCRAYFWFSFPIKPEAQIILGSRIWRGWGKAGRSPEQGTSAPCSIRATTSVTNWLSAQPALKNSGYKNKEHEIVLKPLWWVSLELGLASSTGNSTAPSIILFMLFLGCSSPFFNTFLINFFFKW